MTCTLPPARLQLQPSPRTVAPEAGRSPDRRGILREVGLVLAMLGVYQAARLLGGHNVPVALRHARDLLHVERWLHLPSEAGLQQSVLQVPELVRLLNGYYAGVHLPLTGATLLWLLLRRPDAYRPVRTALFGATAIGLGVYLLLPVAPPRMLPGFTDTGALYGQSVYSSHSLADQYAAMPSLHVGWAVLVAFALISTSRTRWRWLWLLHPAATVLVVVSTGNHYWLDALAGAALTGALLAITRRAGRPDQPPSRRMALASTTASPARSDASRSTTASTTQS